VQYLPRLLAACRPLLLQRIERPKDDSPRCPGSNVGKNLLSTTFETASTSCSCCYPKTVPVEWENFSFPSPLDPRYPHHNPAMPFPYWRSGSARALACVAAAIFAAPVVASDKPVNATALAASQILNDPFPYYFPEENATSAAQLFAMPLCNGVTLEEATIDELQSHMAKGKLTSVQIVMCYMQRAYQTGEYIKYVWPIPCPSH
jgi:hypothetical protein